jgi:hypothetical protein
MHVGPVIWRAVRGPSDASLRRIYPHAPAGRHGILLARLRRIRDVAAQLPQALRILLRSRR